MTVQRDGSRWMYRIEGSLRADGSRRQIKRRGFATKREAQEAEAKAVSEIASGAFVAPSRLTVGAFLTERWLPAIEHTVKPSTWISYRSSAKHLVEHVGSVRLDQVSGYQLSILYGLLVNEHALSPHTARLVHRTAHKALADARAWGLVRHNAADEARQPRKPRPVPKAWRPEHVVTFLAFAKDDRWAAFWRLAVTTGARRAELTAVRRRDLDLDAGIWELCRADSLDRGRIMEQGETKTEDSVRPVPLDACTIEALRDWRRQQLGERLRLGAGWPEHDRVWTWPDGSPLHPDYATKAFARLVEASGLPRLTLHGLRRTWATTAKGRGIHPDVAAGRLGHDPETMLAF